MTPATLLKLAKTHGTPLFVVDHAEARRLYAVAAGLHAWLEWPVLAMALLGAARVTPTNAQSGSTVRHV